MQIKIFDISLNLRYNICHEQGRLLFCRTPLFFYFLPYVKNSYFSDIGSIMREVGV